MKGFIVSLSGVRDEDLIVTTLEENRIGRYYRFYGARHSILQLGYLIDYEEEDEGRGYMPRLRSVTHLPFDWLYERDRLMVWHHFVTLFERHLRDTENLDRFYFDTLYGAALKWGRQNPARIVLDSYISILLEEGRLHPLTHCHICERPLGGEISLMRALIPAHPECIFAPSIGRKSLESYFDTGKSIWLEDWEVEYLYSVIKRGF